MKEDHCSITMVTKRCVIPLLYCRKWENAAAFTLQTVLRIPKCLPLIHFFRVQVFGSVFGGYYKTIFLRIVMVSCLHPVVIVRMKEHACPQVAKSESV